MQHLPVTLGTVVTIGTYDAFWEGDPCSGITTLVTVVTGYPQNWLQVRFTCINTLEYDTVLQKIKSL